MSQQALHRSGKTIKDLEEAISQIHEWREEPNNVDSTYSQLQSRGHIQMRDFNDDYRKSGKLDEAEKHIKQEICDMKTCSENSRTMTLLIHSLSLILSGQGRWDEAQELVVQVMEKRKRVLGPEHQETLISKGKLAITYR
jgi:hypothetical protein